MKIDKLRRWQIVLIGQSNEAGAGEMPMGNGGYGRPLLDPSLPNGTNIASSMWPWLAERLGRYGVQLSMYNTGYGSTGAAEHWCGRCRTWAANMLVGRGSYVLASGGLWKANPPWTFPTSTVAPTGTANMTTADGIPWIYVGVPAGTDTDGTLYAPGSARFDPNGFMTAVGTGLSAANNGGFDRRIVVVSIGQTDKTFSIPRATYAQALQNLTTHALTLGASHVLLGFTCTGNTAGLTAWYDSDLVPGMTDAQTALAGNAAVIPGVNLYARLGALATGPASPHTAGLKTDNLHLNNAALRLAADAYMEKLLSVPKLWN